MNAGLLALAVVAGMISIASPCVLPLLPAYVGVLASSSRSATQRHVLRPALAFVAGFTLVFVALGAVASTVGQLVHGRIDVLTKVAGVAMLAMGAMIVAGARHRIPSPGLLSTAGSLASRLPTSRAVALGAAVAIGWTPCIGPVLASVLALSSSRQTVYEGVLALLLYSAGLAVPFLGLAIGLDRARRLSSALVRRGEAIERCGGVLLVAVGGGYLSGWWTSLWSGVQGWVARTGWPPL